MKQDNDMTHKITIYQVIDKDIVELCEAASEYMVDNVAAGVDPTKWFLFLETPDHTYEEVRGKDLESVVLTATKIPHIRAVCITNDISQRYYALSIWKEQISSFSFIIGHANKGPNGEVIYSRFTSKPEPVGYKPQGDEWIRDIETGWWVRLVKI